MSEKPSSFLVRQTPKAARGGGLPPDRKGGKLKLVQYPTKGSAVRALLAQPEPAKPQMFRLAGRLLEGLPSPSESAPPSIEARRLLLRRGADARKPSVASAPERLPPSDLQLAPTVVPTSVVFGRVVRTRRQILGLTQQDLADAAGVGRRFVSELEGGKPTAELGRSLVVCRVLGLSLVVQQDNG